MGSHSHQAESIIIIRSRWIKCINSVFDQSPWHASVVYIIPFQKIDIYSYASVGILEKIDNVPLEYQDTTYIHDMYKSYISLPIIFSPLFDNSTDIEKVRKHLNQAYMYIESRNITDSS